MPYTLIDHTADIGMKVSAKSLCALFEDAGLGLVDILGGHTSAGDERIVVHAEGIDRVDLLVRWLQEILYLVEVRGLRASMVTIRRLTSTGVEGEIVGGYTGEPLETEIKAVTYHNLDILEIDNSFVATIILDM